MSPPFPARTCPRTPPSPRTPGAAVHPNQLASPSSSRRSSPSTITRTTAGSDVNCPLLTVNEKGTTKFFDIFRQLFSLLPDNGYMNHRFTSVPGLKTDQDHTDPLVLVFANSLTTMAGLPLLPA